MRASGWMILVFAILACLPRSASGAVKMDALSPATLRTLSDLGPESVIAGELRYFNFSYSTFGSSVDPTIRVEAIGDGLRFISSLSASNGELTGLLISYDVAPVDPLKLISGLDLFSDGAAVTGGAGTFVSLMQIARDTDGNVVGRALTNYSDRNFDSDVFEGAGQLRITQSILLGAAPLSAGGGMATLSMVESSVVLIPEPSCSVTAIGTLGVVMWRRRGYKNRRVPRDWAPRTKGQPDRTE